MKAIPMKGRLTGKKVRGYLLSVGWSRRGLAQEGKLLPS